MKLAVSDAVCSSGLLRQVFDLKEKSDDMTDSCALANRGPGLGDPTCGLEIAKRRFANRKT